MKTLFFVIILSLMIMVKAKVQIIQIYENSLTDADAYADADTDVATDSAATAATISNSAIKDAAQQFRALKALGGCTTSACNTACWALGCKYGTCYWFIFWSCQCYECS